MVELVGGGSDINRATPSSFSVSVLLLASVERFGVSRMRDFFVSCFNVSLYICITVSLHHSDSVSCFHSIPVSPSLCDRYFPRYFVPLPVQSGARCCHGPGSPSDLCGHRLHRLLQGQEPGATLRPVVQSGHLAPRD